MLQKKKELQTKIKASRLCQRTVNLLFAPKNQKADKISTTAKKYSSVSHGGRTVEGGTGG